MEDVKETSETTEQQPEEKTYTQADFEALQAEWTQERETLTQKVSELQQKMEQQLITQAFTQTATQKGFANPEKLLQVLNLSNVRVGEDGQVTGLDELFDAIGQVKPDKPKTIGGPTQIGADTNGTISASQIQLEEAAERARQSGRIEDVAFFSQLKTKFFGGN
ncbi:hypothetical protein AM501_06655 [Aneurinibacillus migulanus]|uniref:phage scaffolding protein n=1 Tax=Aneurinibacillus migulanus TaxID=47500 RepID=UPI0005B835A5|nr:hypothetical protein [Aneurinibacillus migulanus]KIV55266.1 hypothetical protein TS64_12010 [Aneurinibacillus migulanus]KPD09032.1 hypothetical protein AM501_06655 [Aneurinibacillus migulanus]